MANNSKGFVSSLLLQIICKWLKLLVSSKIFPLGEPTKRKERRQMSKDSIFQRVHPGNDEDTFQLTFGSVKECIRIIKERSAIWELKNEELALYRTILHLEEYSNLTLWREVFILAQLYPEYLTYELNLSPEATCRKAIRITLARAIAAK